MTDVPDVTDPSPPKHELSSLDRHCDGLVTTVVVGRRGAQ